MAIHPCGFKVILNTIKNFYMISYLTLTLMDIKLIATMIP